MIKSVIYTVAFSLLLFLAVYAGEIAGFFAMPSYTIVIIPYMTITTCIVIAIIQNQRSQILFSQAYIASIVFKILTGLAVILILIRFDPVGARANATLFII